MSTNQEDKPRITNVKISITFLSQKKVADFKNDLLKVDNSKVTYKKNIIILRFKYTCTIFYKPPGKYHVNVTKIRNLEDIDHAITELRAKIFHPSKFQLVKQNVDNLTACYQFKKSFCLQDIAKK